MGGVERVYLQCKITKAEMKVHRRLPVPITLRHRD